MIYKILFMLLLFCATATAGSTTTVTTHIIDANNVGLGNADVIFELYGIATAIDTNYSVLVVPKVIREKTNDTGLVSLSLLRNEYLMMRKSGAVHPWTKVTINHSTLPTPAVMYFTIDADSTGSFSFGKNTNAVQFGAP